MKEVTKDDMCHCLMHCQRDMCQYYVYPSIVGIQCLFYLLCIYRLMLEIE